MDPFLILHWDPVGIRYTSESLVLATLPLTFMLIESIACSNLPMHEDLKLAPVPDLTGASGVSPPIIANGGRIFPAATEISLNWIELY